MAVKGMPAQNLKDSGLVVVDCILSKSWKKMKNGLTVVTVEEAARFGCYSNIGSRRKHKSHLKNL